MSDPIDPNFKVRLVVFGKDGAPKPCGSKITASAPILPENENPSLSTKMARLKRELKVWIEAGAKLVPTEVRKQRLAICEACQYYNARGNMGLGACQAPGCGCSRIKLALATAKCPFPTVPKW